MSRTAFSSLLSLFEATPSSPALASAGYGNVAPAPRRAATDLAVKVTARSKVGLAVLRRTVLSALALGPLVYPRLASAANDPSPNDVAKVVVWFVGAKLGLAAMAYFRNTADYTQFFNDAKSRAKEIDIDINDFPTRPAKTTDGLLALLDYINKGDGATIGYQVFQKYGSYHATLYDVSLKLFLIPLIYDLDADEARTTLVEGMRKKLTGINMPDRLWTPVVNAVAAKKSFDDVRAATIQMNNDVLDYLVAVARGQHQ